MELKQYFYLFKRWLWLLILGLVLGSIAGYVISTYQQPIFQTSTKVMVSSSSNGQLNSPYAFYNDQQLAQNYVELLKTRPVLDGALDTLGYESFSGSISAKQIGQNSSIISITVESSNPQQAADVANQLVLVLMERNETLQTGQYAASEESLQVQIQQVAEQISKYQNDLDTLSSKSLSEQIALVQTQMEPLQAEVSQLQQEIALLTPAWNQERKVKVAEMEARLDQISPLLNLYQQIYTNLIVLGSPGDQTFNNDALVRQLQSTLELYQQIYLNLINSREALRLARLQNTPNVVQIEEAIVPSSPVRPKPLNNILMAGSIGLMLMASIAFLIEYLDDTLKTPEDVQRILNLPVIGFIAEMQPPKDSDEHIYVTRQPRSPVSEAFRSLRVNLEFAEVGKPLRTILITSPGPSEGKTTVAANLAAIISQGGKTTALLDADLRRPRVHKILGIPNRIGLSNLFREQLDIKSVLNSWNGKKEINVITSGSLPPNPAELLGSKRMGNILRELSDVVDVVVIDSPPTLVTDAQVIAPKVDGILLVIQPGHTHANAAIAMVEQFDRAGGRLLGVVFNRIPRNRNHYYGGYQYYSPYYYSDETYHDWSEEGSSMDTQKRKSSKKGPFRSRFSKSPENNSEKEPSSEQ